MCLNCRGTSEYLERNIFFIYLIIVHCFLHFMHFLYLFYCPALRCVTAILQHALECPCYVWKCCLAASPTSQRDLGQNGQTPEGQTSREQKLKHEPGVRPWFGKTCEKSPRSWGLWWITAVPLKLLFCRRSITHLCSLSVTMVMHSDQDSKTLGDQLQIRHHYAS